MKLSELKQELITVLHAQQKTAELIESDNPQTRMIGLLAEERVDIISAIIKRIEGDRVTLICYK